MTRIIDILHPAFQDESENWEKYRYVYNGGKEFVNKYLEKLSTRENEIDFCRRRAMTYAPSFAKAAINEIKNVIFNRLRDVVRHTNSETYNKCVNGQLKGVDNAGTTMDYFIGQYVVPELLTMRKVGIYIDMAETVPSTLADKSTKHPYLYLYPAESIKSWSYSNASDSCEFESVLLYEDQLQYDSTCRLPTGKLQRFRHVYMENGHVVVEFRDLDDNCIDKDGNKTIEPYKYTINIPEIPFVVFEISDSLLKDVADYQIALLNMESADIAYAISANFPIYLEEQDDGVNSTDNMPSYSEEDTEPTDSEILAAKEKVAKVGPTYGRLFPKGAKAPSFIAPSPEPLMAAMDKEKQIKKDIKLLMNLSVNDLSDKMISADSKAQDESGKQTGLACIAYVLEHCERKIAKLWGYYESIIDESTINLTYPKDYDLKSDEQRYKDCADLWELMDKVPSKRYKRELLKKIAETLLNGKVNQKVLQEVFNEIETAKCLLTTLDTIIKAQSVGLVDNESSSEALGFAKGVVEKAKQDHADKLKLIQSSQAPAGGAARGVEATQTNQPTSSDEKKGKPKRGPAK